MIPLGLFHCCLRLRSCLLPARALLRASGFFLPALTLPLPLLSLERQPCLPCRLLVQRRLQLLFLLYASLGPVAIRLIAGQVLGQLGMFSECPMGSHRPL